MQKIQVKRRDKSERKDGRAQLVAIVHTNGQKIRIPVGIAVTKTEWDAAKECIKGRSASVSDRNLIITNVKAKITDVLVKARLTGETITQQSFNRLYQSEGNENDFYNFAINRISEMKTVLSYGTIRHHKAVLEKLHAYAPNLEFADITTDWLRIYAAYLRDKHNNNPGTIGKNMSTIRIYYYAAMKAGKISSNPFEGYKVPSGDPQVVYLLEDELEKLTSLYKSHTLPDNEQDALRFFLFMTFTGMHISDARAVQIEQYFGGELHYHRKKTGTAVIVPLCAPAKELFETYREGRRKGNLFRNLPTDQAFNRLIKRICAKADIQKAVSAKTARHTFATIFHLKSGNLATLSKLLGHTSVNTTMIYAHITRDLRSGGVSVFDGML